MPFVECCRRHVRGELQSQCRLVGLGDGVGEIGSESRLVVIITVVAEECIEALSLAVESWHAEWCSFLHFRLRDGCGDEAVGFVWESHVFKCVNSKHFSHVHLVCYLAFLRIFLRDVLVCHLRVQVAVVAQHSLCHRRSQRWVHPAHQHGLFAETFHHPLGKSAFLSAECVPNPESVGERRAVVGAAEEGSVWCCGESRLHFLLCRDEVVRVFVVFVLYLL